MKIQLPVVFRQVDRQIYDHLIETGKRQRGEGDLSAPLHAGDTPGRSGCDSKTGLLNAL